MLTPQGRETVRRWVWEQFGYSTHEPAVDSFHASTSPIKIISCPARTSKSFAGWKDILPDIIEHGIRFIASPETTETQRGWIVAPNYSLAKEFSYAWTDLVEKGPKLGLGYKINTKPKNSPDQGHMQIVLDWGTRPDGVLVQSIIEVRSATNLQALQSEELDWVILSEAAQLPQIVWDHYLSTRTGRSVWPTTPGIGAVWIWDMIQRAEKDPTLGVDHFRFTGRANPHYKWSRFWSEHKNAEYEIDGHTSTYPADEGASPSVDNGHDCFDELTDCAAMKLDAFAEQFGGRWVFHRGRIVPLRERPGENGQPAHVIHEDRSWFRHADLHVAMDYGFGDGTCVGFWLVGPGQVVLRKSIYEKGLVPDDIVERVLETVHWFEREYEQRKMLKRLVGDPKKPEVAEVFRRRGLPIWDIDKSAQADRKAGHLELMNFLKTDPATGEPGLLVHEENADVIAEWRKLRRNDKVRSEDSPTAFVGADHAYDMARYFVMARPISTVPMTKRVSPFERRRQLVLARKRQQQSTVPSSQGRRRVGGLHIGA